MSVFIYFKNKPKTEGKSWRIIVCGNTSACSSFHRAVRRAVCSREPVMSSCPRLSWKRFKITGRELWRFPSIANDQRRGLRANIASTRLTVSRQHVCALFSTFSGVALSLYTLRHRGRGVSLHRHSRTKGFPRARDSYMHLRRYCQCINRVTIAFENLARINFWGMSV